MIEGNDRKIISVLIATYNHDKYLMECLESVESAMPSSKEFGNLEIELIIIDDGSTDQTQNIIKEFLKNKQLDRLILKYVYQKNQGQSMAYENALPLISGEIVFLLDSDDRFLPTKLEKVIKVFDTYKDVGLVAHPLFVVNKDGNRTGEIRPKAAKISHGDIRGTIKKYARNVAPATSGLAFRSEIFRRIHPNPLKGFASAADSYLSFAAAFYSPVYHLSEPLAEYRQHDSNYYFKRICSLEGLEKTVSIQNQIVNHFGLGKNIFKNSYYMRNILALKKMKFHINWIKSLIHLNRAIIIDPSFSLNKKILLLTYWNIVSLFPRKQFWRFWIKFNKIQMGIR